MCGTILNRNGQILTDDLQRSQDGNFANRLVKVELGSQVRDMFNSKPSPTVNDIKLLIETALKDKNIVKKANAHDSRFQRAVVLSNDKVALRRLMSCVWENSSIFSMELGGAVIRQSLFVDKMQKLDWLHSPAASNTMSRLLVKYQRFIELMATFPGKCAVPTLDVDLAWHTHRKQALHQTILNAN